MRDITEVSETFAFNSILPWLIAREDLILCESFKYTVSPYIITSVFKNCLSLCLHLSFRVPHFADKLIMFFFFHSVICDGSEETHTSASSLSTFVLSYHNTHMTIIGQNFSKHFAWDFSSDIRLTSSHA
jgi:hypothetical protein